eukprot:2166557-Prymnesium_polylepis.1
MDLTDAWYGKKKKKKKNTVRTSEPTPGHPSSSSSSSHATVVYAKEELGNVMKPVVLMRIARRPRCSLA